ncbi:FAD-dependent oxidoreductase [Pseudorhodoplanes sp.]|uniref:FAD-dependent oxidoreductase n=1 Tax=Pseudorhodoplanes sp. TaxID=1934341 RepID=UPI002C513EEE|nr:FAD-dependent oxidoreductase [Pseudorhodoplanes sp.]HWV51558.1 FAD-dependent oxidoreductase [Pseudorhodoplanes sp.]
MTDVKTPVLIVGAGPVGLIGALDLAWRGIDVVIVEQRYAGEPPPVKCNHVSSRSMEILRRLGLAEAIRAAGLPHDYPNDVAFCTTVTGTEFSRIRIPSVNGRSEPPSVEHPDSTWPTPEPPHRINQLYLEPILFEHAAKEPRIRILNRCILEEIDQTDEAVTARVRNLETGATLVINASYAIGCDGARSTVRRSIGAKFVGEGEIARNLSSFIRAPALLEMIRSKRKPSWMSQAINPRRAGNAIAIDGNELWLIHCRVKPHETDFALIDRDRAIRDVLGVDNNFAYELLGKEDWIARRLVADRMRKDRIFLCGDSAHIWIPVAGYGMNCGIADVVGLTWMLAAVINGWAPPSILDAFERERHPITEQVSRFVAELGVQLVRRRNEPPAGIEAEGAEGDAVRARFGQEMYDMNVGQYCCGGLNFGYFYEDSPLIFYDGEQHPAYSMASFTPSTVPGCRLPHAWLRDGRSIYDALGPEYTLLRFDPSIDASGLIDAAVSHGFPMALLDVDIPPAGGVYGYPLLIVRPDRHVAWRGHAINIDPDRMIGRLRGEDRAGVAGAQAA